MITPEGIITSILDHDIPFGRLMDWIACDDCGVKAYLERIDVFSPSFTFDWKELRKFCRQDVHGECRLEILDQRFADLQSSAVFPGMAALRNWIVAIAVLMKENLSRRFFRGTLETHVNLVVKWRQEMRWALQEGVEQLKFTINNIP